MEKADADIKGFLYPRMYRHDARDAGDGRGRKPWCATCSRIMSRRRPTCRRNGRRASRSPTRARRARRIADYIAGMTDRYALVEHAKYFETTPELR